MLTTTDTYAVAVSSCVHFTKAARQRRIDLLSEMLNEMMRVVMGLLHDYAYLALLHLNSATATSITRHINKDGD